MLFILVFATFQIHTLAQHLGPTVYKPDSDHDYITNISLIAPLFHNVSAGPAWVVPKSNDLNDRSMSCECFDPNQTCCIPSSAVIAPFCIPQGSSCCGNTYCEAGETCCGGSCCPALTTCSPTESSASCCPLNATCTGPPATCYDHSSPTCSDPFKSPPQCCPLALPYCRAYEYFGIGCFVSSTYQAALVTNAPTNLQLPPGSLTQMSTAGASTSVASYTGTVTATIMVYTLSSGSITYEYPTSSDDAPGNPLVKTIWDFDILTASSTTSTTTSLTGPSVLPNGQTVGLSLGPPASSTSPSATILSSRSALCFNEDQQKDLPCSVTSTAMASKTPYVYSPPGMSIVSSDSSRINPLGFAGSLLALYLICSAVYMTWSIFLMCCDVIMWMGRVIAGQTWILNSLIYGSLNLAFVGFGTFLSYRYHDDIKLAVTDTAKKSAGNEMDTFTVQGLYDKTRHSMKELWAGMDKGENMAENAKDTLAAKRSCDNLRCAVEVLQAKIGIMENTAGDSKDAFAAWRDYGDLQHAMEPLQRELLETKRLATDNFDMLANLESEVDKRTVGALQTEMGETRKLAMDNFDMLANLESEVEKMLSRSQDDSFTIKVLVETISNMRKCFEGADAKIHELEAKVDSIKQDLPKEHSRAEKGVFGTSKKRGEAKRKQRTASSPAIWVEKHDGQEG